MNDDNDDYNNYDDYDDYDDGDDLVPNAWSTAENTLI